MAVQLSNVNGTLLPPTITGPIFKKTAAYGHFGRTEPEFTWEATDKAESLRVAAGLEAVAV